VLTETVAMHRIKLLTKIARLLLTMIPSERGYKMKEEHTPYTISRGDDDLLAIVHMP
jgi:hypothetical protein